MKRLATALALATLVASPAFAQSYDPDVGSGNIAPSYGQTAKSSVNRDARSAFARVLPGATMSQSQNAVHDEQGNAVGTDPDPNIRFQLHRESEEGEW